MERCGGDDLCSTVQYILIVIAVPSYRDLRTSGTLIDGCLKLVLSDCIALSLGTTSLRAYCVTLLKWICARNLDPRESAKRKRRGKKNKK